MTNTVYFANAGYLDLDVIRIMGVSVKVNENPIGYFGTGLKYAIAVLLRTGHEIKLTVDDEQFEFTARDYDVRGKEFKRIYMNDEALPFTTELGKNWEVWQAYRELHSNTRDECGVITDKESEVRGAETRIAVTGTAMHREYLGRSKIFVEGKPLFKNMSIEVHEGETNSVYYRGVRAGDMPKKMQFRYNFLTPMELTEDRTFRSAWDVEYALSTLIPTITHEGIIAEIMSIGDFWEKTADFNFCGAPSKEFIAQCEREYSNMDANSAARKIVDGHRQSKGEFKRAVMTDVQHTLFLDAFQHLHAMGSTLSPEDVEVAETLGPNTLGLYHRAKGQIFVAKCLMDKGAETIVSTLFEEWCHKEHGFSDCSRAFQTYLLDRLTAMGMQK